MEADAGLQVILPGAQPVFPQDEDMFVKCVIKFNEFPTGEYDLHKMVLPGHDLGVTLIKSHAQLSSSVPANIKQSRLSGKFYFKSLKRTGRGFPNHDLEF